MIGHRDGTLYRVTVKDGGKIKIVGLLTFEGATLFLKRIWPEIRHDNDDTGNNRHAELPVLRWKRF